MILFWIHIGTTIPQDALRKHLNTFLYRPVLSEVEMPVLSEIEVSWDGLTVAQYPPLNHWCLGCYVVCRYCLQTTVWALCYLNTLIQMCVKPCKGTQIIRIIVIFFRLFSFGGAFFDRFYAGMLILPSLRGKDAAIKVSACHWQCWPLERTCRWMNIMRGN